MRYPPTCWGNIRNHFTGVRRESKRSKAISVYPQTYVGSINKRRNVTNMILPSFEEHNAIFSGTNTLMFRCKLPQPYLDMSTLPSWRWRKEILMKIWRISTKTYSATSQKTAVFLFPTKKNLKSCSLHLYLFLLISLSVMLFHCRMNSDEIRVFDLIFTSR